MPDPRIGRALWLYDIFAKKVRAEVLDLNHGAQFVPHCRVDGGDDLAVTASQIVIVTAGAKQKPGQTRLELAATNVAMARLPGRGDRVRHQPRRRHHLRRRGFRRPPAGTHLRIGHGAGLQPVPLSDRRAGGLAVGNVHGFIVGEHGDSEISLWSSVSIGGVPADHFRVDGELVFDAASQTEISSDVVNAAYEIIEGKGATNLAIGLSTARIIEAIRGHQHRVLPVSTLQTGAHGLNDVCLSLPTVVSAEGAGQVLEIPLSDGAGGTAGLGGDAADAWESVN